ncbi:MAG TPA: c-type cytochrome, partial [Bryobacteraceae bacterium]|nr:c-type cytochrome [Bryobacteraceae bacterium]
MIRIAVLVLCCAALACAQSQFIARCAGCHGEDGLGGGHGPAIVGLASPKAASVEAVRAVILGGIAGTGMPAFSIPESEAEEIAGFVVRLRAPVAGDAAAGERFFLGQGKCSECHRV